MPIRSVSAFFRRPASWPLVAIPLLLLLWARFLAPGLVLASFNSATLFDSPYRGALPPGPAGRPIARHVVLIVLDGLRVDASRQMAEVNRLRARGADRPMHAGLPSLSLPGWTVIGTGAWQEQSGITSNFTTDHIALDTIFLAAHRAGLKTAVVGNAAWLQLYDAGVDIAQVRPGLPDALEPAVLEARDSLYLELALIALAQQPDLLLLYLPGPDAIAHDFGGASAEYRDIAQFDDGLLERLLAAVSLDDTAVVVTSDHGHLDAGGHGGAEPVVLQVPFVAAGQGIRPGVYPEAAQADIAPTLAVLLGLSIPAHNQGEALFDELDAPDEVKAARAVDLAQEVAARFAAMLATIGAPAAAPGELSAARAALAAGQYAQTLALARQSDEAARAQWDAARGARLTRERLARVPVAALVLAPFGLYLAWWRRARWPWHGPAAAALAFFAVWYADFFLLRRLSYSFSIINTEASFRAFLAASVVAASVALAVAMVVAGAWRRTGNALDVVRDAVHAEFAVAGLLAIQILVFYVAWGVTYTWALPDVTFGFKYFVDVFVSAAFWPTTFLPAAVLLPLVALAAAWLRRAPARRLASLARSGR